MVFEDDVFYNLKPENTEKSKAYPHLFYARMTDPLPMLTIICGIIGYNIQSTYPVIAAKFRDGDRYAPFWAALLAVTMFIGARLFHSLHWAKKDYAKLEFGISDFLTFGCVIFFTSGTIFSSFKDEPLLTLVIYVILSLMGIWNFYNLGLRKIPSDPRHYDVAIEKRIQVVNFVVFLFVSMLLILTIFVVLRLDAFGQYSPCLALAPILLLMTFNIAHSHQLSIWPKMLVNNGYLAPDKIADRLKMVIGLDNDHFMDHPGLKAAMQEYTDAFVPVVLRRAAARDIEYIAEMYLRSFSYVLDLILADEQAKAATLLHRCLRSNFGLGVIGYLRFYIIEVENRICGILMPEFRTSPKIYNTLGQLSLLWILLRHVGLSRTRRTIRNIGRLRALESEPTLKEVRIAYLAIDPADRRKGYASHVLRLIRQAFRDSSTNEFHAQSISAYVRGDNRASIDLFTKSGFIGRTTASPANGSDVFAIAGGGLVKFTSGAA